MSKVEQQKKKRKENIKRLLTIRIGLPNATKVTIEVFNILGDKVATLVNEKQFAGIHSVEWDGKDASGRSVGNGIYFYKISTREFSATKKMLLMK